MTKRNIIISLTASLLMASSCQRLKETQKLETDLDSLLTVFHDVAGLYVYAPAYSLEYAYYADSLFPTASLIKVPILCSLWDRIGQGNLSSDSVVRFYPDSLHYPYKGEDALARFRPGEDISVSQLMTHMMTFSDNHASLYLQQLAGGGNKINAWLQQNGFSNTHVNARTPGREEAAKIYGWGQTTPREMAMLLWKIRHGEIMHKKTSEQIYRYLTRSYWDKEALSQIPPTVQVASKQGAVNQSRSEVLLVNAPQGDYVFCIITKNQRDTSWNYSNEGFVLIRNISARLWKYFGENHEF